MVSSLSVYQEHSTDGKKKIALLCTMKVAQMLSIKVILQCIRNVVQIVNEEVPYLVMYTKCVTY